MNCEDRLDKLIDNAAIIAASCAIGLERGLSPNQIIRAKDLQNIDGGEEFACRIMNVCIETRKRFKVPLK